MPEGNDPSFEAARQLWAGRFQGVISTHCAAEPGYPFGSVVPFCLDRNGLPVLLFSHLAQHARNLEADPRCALTVHEAVPGDVQQSQRLTCIGTCAPCNADAQALRRYLSYFPGGRIYAEQLNFRPYRLMPKRCHYNGGFAAARWLGRERILRHSTLDEDAEATLASALARTHGPRLAALHPPLDPGETDATRIAGIDPWGLDLARGERLRRISFPRAMADPAVIGTYLDSLPAEPAR